MVNLIARTPAETLLPQALETGSTRVEEVRVQAMTWVAPFDGQMKSVSALMETTFGIAFPGPNRTTRSTDERALWCGPEQALILGPPVSVEGAACVDQSDAWCILKISGAAAPDVLSRLTPLDLRDSVFPLGATARTLVGHMTASLTRVDETSFEIMVFRSMAKTLLHELSRSMHHVAAREGL